MIGIARNADKVATFTPNSAPLNFAAVENLDVQGLGGADQITGQNGIAGLTKLTIDGGGDGAADTVIENGTAKKDNVSVTRSGAQVLTTGLAAQTSIVGSEAANDTLGINTLGGDDRATVAPDVSDLITTVVDLGADE